MLFSMVPPSGGTGLYSSLIRSLWLPSCRVFHFSAGKRGVSVHPGLQRPTRGDPAGTDSFAQASGTSVRKAGADLSPPRISSFRQCAARSRAVRGDATVHEPRSVLMDP